jgi:hypothetical protein
MYELSDKRLRSTTCFDSVHHRQAIGADHIEVVVIVEEGKCAHFGFLSAANRAMFAMAVDRDGSIELLPIPCRLDRSSVAVQPVLHTLGSRGLDPLSTKQRSKMGDEAGSDRFHSECSRVEKLTADAKCSWLEFFIGVKIAAPSDVESRSSRFSS